MKKTIDFSKTGWISIPANIKTIVAYFKDGHTEKMTSTDFLVLKPKRKNQIVKIDCYDEEKICNLSHR